MRPSACLSCPGVVKISSVDPVDMDSGWAHAAAPWAAASAAAESTIKNSVSKKQRNLYILGSQGSLVLLNVVKYNLYIMKL
jgi:hypothetical protein